MSEDKIVRVGGKVFHLAHNQEQVGSIPTPAIIGSHAVQYDKVGQCTVTKQGLKKLIKYTEEA